MFVYLTGCIDLITTIDIFRKIEKELREKDIGVNNVINIAPMDDKKYKIERIKSVLKADKVIFIEGYEKSIDCCSEYAIAEYIGIEIEIYKVKG
jgi:hypothetical protein